MEDVLNDATDKLTGNFVGASQQAEMVSYLIFGAVVSTTRAFKSASLKIDTDNNRVYVAVTLRWFFSSKRFHALHDIWLARAERKAKPLLPTGWRLLVYYAKT